MSLDGIMKPVAAVSALVGPAVYGEVHAQGEDLPGELVLGAGIAGSAYVASRPGSTGNILDVFDPIFGMAGVGLAAVVSAASYGVGFGISYLGKYAA